MASSGVFLFIATASCTCSSLWFAAQRKKPFGHSKFLAICTNSLVSNCERIAGSSNKIRSRTGLVRNALGNCGPSLIKSSGNTFGLETTLDRVFLSLLCDSFDNSAGETSSLCAIALSTST